jgi:hypothetical protein
MNNFKGSGILAIDKLFKAQNPELREKFLAALSPEELKAYKTCLPISWVPTTLAVAISEKAADVLYPGDPRRLFNLGRDRAIVHINGMYKILFKLMNVNTVLEQAGKLWPTQHDSGKVNIEIHSKTAADFCVSEYPSLLKPFYVLIEGFINGVLTTAGAKNVKVTFVGTNPNLLTWKATWE